MCVQTYILDVETNVVAICIGKHYHLEWHSVEPFKCSKDVCYNK